MHGTNRQYEHWRDSVDQEASVCASDAQAERVQHGLAQVAEHLIRLRREREALFGAGLFADPAWDILLDLLIARETGRPVSISSLCIASAVPATTALRSIQLMTSRGLLERYPDKRDRRRHWIGLTPKAYEYLASLLRGRFSLDVDGALKFSQPRTSWRPPRPVQHRS